MRLALESDLGKQIALPSACVGGWRDASQSTEGLEQKARKGGGEKEREEEMEIQISASKSPWRDL